MKSSKPYLILLLAATTVGGAVLAWRQYGELVELRAAAMNRGERADLQKRVWDLENLNRELQDQLAAQRDSADVDGLLAAATGADGERSSRERGGRGDRGGDSRGRGSSGLQQATAMRELMSKPEVQAMLSLQQKAAIEARYATLFKNLNLPVEQIEKLKTLLADRSTTMQDLMTVAREQGINARENPEAFRKLIADAQNDINSSIKSVIGEQGFAQLATYEQTLPQRNVVNELQQRLSYTNTPLTSAQAEQMVQILANNTPQRPAGTSTSDQRGPSPGSGRGGPPPSGGIGPGFSSRGSDVGGMISGVLGGGPGAGMLMGAFDGGSRGTTPVTSGAVSQAQTVLAPPQVAALQQIQQQQQSQQQLRQLVNDTLTAKQPDKAGSSPISPSSSTSPTGTGAASPSRRRGGGG